MLGQGGFQDKQIRLQVLQEIANKDNDILDRMIDEQKMDPNTAYKTFANQYKEDVKQRKVELPYQTNRKFMGIGKNISLGFDQDYKKPSVNNINNQNIDRLYKSLKDQSFADQRYADLKQTKLQLQKTRQYSTKDHLAETEKGLGHLNLNSVNRQDLNYTKDMDEYNKNINHDYHIKKNDLNSYAESYIRCKLTIRK
ncbi:hypothetical protein PPERSA_07576 [Pseudocohnilembus persalinus]|uniref:Uncharacterized protein n=1 Tax=Pseudocohnilembus persalinus TaxID=266149 RepID=A0A0V0QZX2_PSEPJ|nr:hypothetical protein PPERSA_07576 [Pseudocohnilembus persalinus]|eukprot:KRX07826.1 hypothetical protein PPERSA_07576 [Pseudocohnilembus persalinus]